MPIRTTLQKHRVQWILNALAHIKPESPASKRVVTWIAEQHHILGITLPKGFTVQETPKKGKSSSVVSLVDDEDGTQDNPDLKKKRLGRYETIRAHLQKNLDAAKKSTTLSETAVEKNLTLLAGRINLSPEDRETLLFYIDFRANKFSKTMDALREDFSIEDYFECVARFLSIEPEVLKNKLSKESVLRNFISVKKNETYYGDRTNVDFISSIIYEGDKVFIDALSELSSTADEIIARLLGPTPTTELTLADFAYLGQDRLDYFVEALRGAVEGNGNKRKNSSLYGVAGVGKTELTAVIAKHLNVPLYSIGLSHLEDDKALSDNAKEPTRQDRLLAWRRAAFLVNASHTKCLFLFDEADDILRDPNEDKNSNRASKAYLNWLLDNNNVPTIFVTNNIERFEESTIRRILPALGITSAPRAVQAKILLGYAKKYELEISPEEAKVLTRDYSGLTSAVIETILYKTSRRTDIKGNPVAQFRALQIGFSESAAALNQGVSPIPEITMDMTGFDPKLSPSQLDIPSLVEDFKKAKSLKGLSLCLYGAQGTGKKTLMQYVGDQLGMNTIFLNFNDLYGMQGFSAVALSQLLKGALSERAVLVFNDASRLLSGAEWQRLDSHPFFRAIAAHDLPVGVTLHDSELLGDITPQQFWRITGQFAFAARMTGLSKAGHKLALEKIMGLSADMVDKVLEGIKEASDLVVGDFARVAKQMTFRPSAAKNPDEILKALNHSAMQSGQASIGSPSSF